jgi:hypothetical protein
MLEVLPDNEQERVIEKVREYIADIQDELHWNSQFEKSQSELVTAARKARAEIADGHSETMDVETLSRRKLRWGG